MNYLAFCGYWFYGGTSAAQTASFFCSWGLLASAPLTGVISIVKAYYYKFLVEI